MSRNSFSSSEMLKYHSHNFDQDTVSKEEFSSVLKRNPTLLSSSSLLYHKITKGWFSFVSASDISFPWKESYDQPRRHVVKQRHYFANKVHLAKAMVFPVVMYGCESWTIKKAERRRIEVFELWCWRRLLRVPLTARRSNQSILKISPECLLEGLMSKLKLQYFGHLMRRADSLEKTLMLGKMEDWRRRG